jgi:hypothetical protein
MKNLGMHGKYSGFETLRGFLPFTEIIPNGEVVQKGSGSGRRLRVIHNPLEVRQPPSKRQGVLI